ncbi:hypothetical protein [Rubrivivax gelatinosus]|nr:hypothetical protein [Rubrivivax gelatinosus]
MNSKLRLLIGAALLLPVFVFAQIPDGYERVRALPAPLNKPRLDSDPSPQCKSMIFAKSAASWENTPLRRLLKEYVRYYDKFQAAAECRLSDRNDLVSIDGRFVASRIQQALGVPVTGALTLNQAKHLAGLAFPEDNPYVALDREIIADANQADLDRKVAPNSRRVWGDLTRPPHIVDFLPAPRKLQPSDCQRLEKAEEATFIDMVQKGVIAPGYLQSRERRFNLLPRSWNKLREDYPELEAWHARFGSEACIRIVAWKYLQSALGNQSNFFSDISAGQVRQLLMSAKSDLNAALEDYHNLRIEQERNWRADASKYAAAESILTPAKSVEIGGWLKGVSFREAQAALPAALCSISGSSFECAAASLCRAERSAIKETVEPNLASAESLWNRRAEFGPLGKLIALQDAYRQCELRAEVSPAGMSAITLFGHKVEKLTGVRAASEGSKLNRLIAEVDDEAGVVSALTDTLGEPRREIRIRKGMGLVGIETISTVDKYGLTASSYNKPVYGDTEYHDQEWIWRIEKLVRVNVLLGVVKVNFLPTR